MSFVILGHELVKPAELYAVSLRIRRNIIDASYDIDAGHLVIEEYYYSTRKIHEYHFKIIHYPLKSGSGISSGFCTGSMNGITGDRIYCLFDSENNKFITLRDTPLLTDILITEIDGRLSVSIEGKISEFDTPPPLDGVIKIWSREVDVTVFEETFQNL